MCVCGKPAVSTVMTHGGEQAAPKALCQQQHSKGKGEKKNPSALQFNTKSTISKADLTPSWVRETTTAEGPN